MASVEKSCETCETCQAELGSPGTDRDTKPSTKDIPEPNAFVPPDVPLITPSVVIEFCHKCRWLHRASWTQTELFLTFPPPVLKSITLIPHDTPEASGRFRLWLATENKNHSKDPLIELIWDRKTQGGFPELKDLKQGIRDRIQPNLSLGHSDKKTKE
ncbi:uncharacterized protein EI90DRAFT_2942139 [Cantharellus anzutake]|uniref:uncharacterized protein n=1 Tax=Cantharellus anzutake TaxID=1750568 RepID=UPI001903FD0A|nr:uncharacterized protein EI90DRAFT_2942139 [Cantharellus anzutake]KAF8318299.1 hypothetical protein EI90DRAFT_2942139 [Cantharellus anzutake]